MEMWKTPLKRTAASRQGKGQSGADRPLSPARGQDLCHRSDRRRKALINTGPYQSNGVKRAVESVDLGNQVLSDMEDKDDGLGVRSRRQALWRKDHLGVSFSVAGGRATAATDGAPLKSRAAHTYPVRRQTGANFAGIFTGQGVAASAVD